MDNYYDSISKGYTKLHMEEQQKKLSIIKKNLKIKKNFLLLDVGCGTGISSDFACKVICIDPSLGLVRQSVKTKVNGEAEHLPFKDGIFDAVISVTAIHNFQDIGLGLHEMKRVGKNLFVFSVLKKSANFERIKSLILKNFSVKKTIEEEKDLLFFVC